MPSFDISIGYDDPDEIRALYQSVLRAKASELVERDRLRRLGGTGYQTNSPESADMERERVNLRYEALVALMISVGDRMHEKGIKPW